MKLLQTLESIDDKLGKLLDRISEGTVHANPRESHAFKSVSSSDRKMTATTAYIERMTKERDELIDKYHKLSRYLVNHKEELSKEEIRLMNNQYRIMLKYSEILYERIGIALNK